jgi:hypothetical protein
MYASFHVAAVFDLRCEEFLAAVDRADVAVAALHLPGAINLQTGEAGFNGFGIDPARSTGCYG